MTVDENIVERHYRLRAIRAVGEALQAKQRETLLVMATGSGKTRTAIALVEQLMRAGWVKRVLFLADRIALGEPDGLRVQGASAERDDDQLGGREGP